MSSKGFVQDWNHEDMKVRLPEKQPVRIRPLWLMRSTVIAPLVFQPCQCRCSPVGASPRSWCGTCKVQMLGSLPNDDLPWVEEREKERREREGGIERKKGPIRGERKGFWFGTFYFILKLIFEFKQGTQKVHFAPLLEVTSFTHELSRQLPREIWYTIWYS